MEHFRYLLQGKLINAGFSQNKALFILQVSVPKNTAQSYVSDTPLFEEITIELSFSKAIIGWMNNNTSEITLEDDAIILSSFENNVFRSDLGTPEHYNVDDIKLPELVNVDFKCICENKYELSLIIPTPSQMPCIHLVFDEFVIKDLEGKLIGYDALIDDLSIFYKNHYLSFKDRTKVEWEFLYGIKNSFDFYQNRLGSYWAFDEKLNPQYKNLTRPLWVEVMNIKYNDVGYIDSLTIVNTTKRKSDLKDFKNEVFWLPPIEYSSVLSFLSVELFNSAAENLFDEILDLYISKWEPEAIFDLCLIHDLKRLINADETLSNHSGKSKFFSQLDYWLEQRKLVTV